jgi:hypothetical protein
MLLSGVPSPPCFCVPNPEAISQEDQHGRVRFELGQRSDLGSLGAEQLRRVVRDAMITCGRRA